jgi:alpha-tubulin suppressor-like RCC1 family protein
MNRRQVLSLLASVPLAARLQAQTRATAQHRVVLSTEVGFLFEPGGSLQAWVNAPGAREEEEAPDRLGLGHGRPVYKHTLYPVPGLTNVVAAAAGMASYAVLSDGSLLAWGPNARGVLGTTPLAEFEERAQPRARTSTPTPVAVRFDAVNVSSTGDHALALARDGSVYAWGNGASGQLGIGRLPLVSFKTRSPRVVPDVPYPVRIPDLGDVIALGAGATHSLALRKEGTVLAWGDNRFGQVGDGTIVNRDRPVVVPGVRNAVAIAAGAYFSVAILSDGTAMEWGAAYDSSTASRLVPTLLPGVRGARSVVAGGGHAAVITRDGAVVTWGASAHYETGRGRNAGAAPTPVRQLADVRFLAACKSQTIAVLGSGRMMTWGEVRGWKQQDDGGWGLSPYPILLWLDGLEQP